MLAAILAAALVTLLLTLICRRPLKPDRTPLIQRPVVPPDEPKKRKPYIQMNPCGKPYKHP